MHCQYVPADISQVNYNPYTAPTHVRHTVLSTQGIVQRNPCSPVDDNSYTAASCSAYLSVFQKKSKYLLRKPANPHKGTMWPSRHCILSLKLKQNSQTQKEQKAKSKNNTCATQTQPTKQQQAGLSTSVESEKEKSVADQLQALTELSATRNNVQKKVLRAERFIVFSALCFASPAACCWCRDSCCLFLEVKSLCFDEIQPLQVTPG